MINIIKKKCKIYKKSIYKIAYYEYNTYMKYIIK